MGSCAGTTVRRGLETSSEDVASNERHTQEDSPRAPRIERVERVDLSDQESTLSFLRRRHLVPEGAEFVAGAPTRPAGSGIRAIADYTSEMEGLHVALSCAEGFGDAELSSQNCLLWVHALGAPEWGASHAVLFDRGEVVTVFGPSLGVRWRVARDPFFHVVVEDAVGGHSQASYETVYRDIGGRLTPTLRIETESTDGVDPEYPEREYRRASWTWRQDVVVATGRAWAGIPNMSECVQSVRRYRADVAMPQEPDGVSRLSSPDSERVEPCARPPRALDFRSFSQDRCHARAPAGTFCDAHSPAN